MPDRVISKSIAFLKARSNFVVDLNNDMTSVVLDERGSTKTAISLSTVVRAFYGTRNVIGDCTVTAVSEDPDMNVTYDSTNNTVNIDISADTDLYDTTTITITVVHASYGTRTTTFTIVAVKEGDGAFIQELLPSLSDISFKRTIAGALDPTSRTLSLSIKKTEGGTTEEQTISDSDLYVRWSTSSMPSSRDAGTAWGSGTVTGITWSSGSMVIANSVDVSNIYIAAFKADNTLVDMETIPVIKDGEHGDAAPYYFQEWFAWSNVESTVNATTSPFGNNTEPNPAWNTSIPENTGGLAYLWRKSVRYVWDSSNRSYSTERAQYFRMSGTNGTSINTKGEVNYAYNNYSDLPTTSSDIGKTAFIKSSAAKYTCFDYQGALTWISGQPATAGDAYTVKDAGNFGGGSIVGHLIQLNSEANTWLDLGQFKGESGVTYYTHIAWATEVTLESSELPIPDGQTNKPNALAANISGFSITPLSGVSYAWIGYLIDTNSSDSQTKQNYTWQRNKGEKGKDASEVNPNILLRTIFDKGIDFVKEQWSSNWSGTSIDTATDTIVEGRKSIRINAGMLSTNEFIDFRQNVYGKLKPSTWYTLSFNYFSTHNFSTFLWGGDNTPLVIDRSAGFYQDGTFIAEPPIDGNVHWEADWTGARHTLTFKTRDTFPSEYFWVMFRTYHIDGTTDRAQLALCMPKLEIGEVATAYMANEDDLRGEKGDQGDRGKVGRFFYFGGVFNAADTTQTFIVNDAQAPYFEHTESGQKRYHVFNYETNGSYTMAQMWAASQQSWNDKPWEVMTDDFKYLITEAIFASFAHFGSAIINGDWMMSCFGIIYDTSGGSHVIDSKNASWTSGGVTYNYANAYTLFDVDYPNSSKPSALNFVPYYCVDMLAGAVYQQNAFVKGTIEADRGHIGGFIINSTQIKSSDNNNNIILNSDGTATLGVLSITASGTSITGDLTVNSTSGMYFKLRPSTTGNASISAYNNSGQEMVTLGINTYNRPSLFLGVPIVGSQNYKQTLHLDPEQLSLLGTFGTNEYLSTLDNGLEYLGSISDYYAQTGGNSWKRLQIGIRNGNVLLKARDDDGDSAWPQPTIGGSDFQSLAKGQVFLGPSQNYGSYRYAPLYVRLQ